MPSFARALWAYTAIEDNELSFEQGDIIEIVELCNSDWYEGKLNGTQAYFPANRVVLLKETTAVMPETLVLESSPIVATQTSIHTSTPNLPSRPSSTLPTTPAPTLATPPPPRDPFSDDLADAISPPRIRGLTAASGDVKSSETVEYDDDAQIDALGDDLETVGLNAAPAATVEGEDKEEEEELESPTLQGGLEDIDVASVSTPPIAAVTTDTTEPAAGQMLGHGSDIASIVSLNGSTWKPMRDTSGQIYYWNPTTNHTSWDPPTARDLQSTPNLATNHYLSSPTRDGAGSSFPADDASSRAASLMGSENDIHGLLETTAAPPLPHRSHPAGSPSATSVDSSTPDLDLSRFEHIPQDLIRREGSLKYKLSTTHGAGGGAKHRLQSSWKGCLVVMCVGVAFLFKEGGHAGLGKSKKSHLVPFDALLLTQGHVEPAGKEHTSKKNAFLVTLASGRRRLFLTDSEATTTAWIDSFRECMRERHTASEYESVLARVFTKSTNISTPLIIGDPLPSLPPTLNSQLRTPATTDAAAMSKTSSNASSTTATATTRKSINVFSKSIFGSSNSTSTLSNKNNKPAKSPAVTSPPPRPELPFGGHLPTQLEFEGTTIPRIVTECIATVESRDGFEVQGIYRLSGNSATIGRLKAAVNTGEVVDLGREDDINVVTGLLKSYFRELQNPLIPFEVYDQFIVSAKLSDYNERLIQLKTLIQALPQCNYNVLSYLLKHLKKYDHLPPKPTQHPHSPSHLNYRVAEKSDINKMEQSNLAIVFAPTLIRSIPPPEGQDAAMQGYASMANMPFHNKLIESMIEQYEWLFDGSKD
ncbi:Rho GTPase-activating protein 15 [Podochytrium sp. JEL0797]|nr:Rho GTPase-activating protein 15 [Podochytrium sp. JEL0797]